MNKLILHIGTHKTGSTAIQRWLHSNPDLLRQHGFKYGDTSRADRHWIKQHTSLYRALSNPNFSFEVEKKAILDDFNASGCHTLILSAEGLSEPSFWKMIRMKEFSEFFDITVICFLRRQDYFIESFWGENSKQSLETRTLEDFFNDTYLGRRLRYDTLLDFWSEFTTIKAVAYADILKLGAVAKFAQITDIPFDGSTARINKSPSMNCAAMMNILSRRKIRFNPFLLKQLFVFDRRKYALGSRLRTQVLNDLKESNQRLAEKYSVTFSDEMPREGGEPILHPSILSLVTAATLGVIALIPGIGPRIWKN